MTKGGLGASQQRGATGHREHKHVASVSEEECLCGASCNQDGSSYALGVILRPVQSSA
jgi:hypothetical protein